MALVCLLLVFLLIFFSVEFTAKVILHIFEAHLQRLFADNRVFAK